MIETIKRAITGERGAGYIHADLPQGTRHLSALIGAGGEVLPPSASVYDARVQPKDQSASNSCLAHSAAQAYRIACLVQGVDCPDLAALPTYAWGCASIGLQGQDIGMTFAATLTAVERFGIATEESYPFSLIKVTRNPSASALHSAYDRRGLRGYYAIEQDDVMSVRRAIAKKLPVMTALPIDEYFGLTGPELIDVPVGTIRGYHSTVVEDYRADGTFGILNHYGPNFRNNGRCRFTERYLRMSQGFIVFDVKALP